MCEKCEDSGMTLGRRTLIGSGIGAMAASLVPGIAAAQSATTTTTRAYAASSEAGVFAPIQIRRRAPGPDDVAIDILYCGVCHTDVHNVRGEWGQKTYPYVPGHEFVGRVTAVGARVTKLRVGDIAGVGCMLDSCGSCENCTAGLEQYCLVGNTLTYGSPDTVLGGQTYGGYSDHVVVKERFVVKVPANADLPSTAPCCAQV